MNARTKTRNIVFWLLMVLFAIVIWHGLIGSPQPPQSREISFTQFLDELDKDNILSVTLTGSESTGMFKAGGTLRNNREQFETTLPENYPDLYKTLREKKVSTVFDAEVHRPWLSWVVSFLPMVLLIGIWFYFMRQMRKPSWWNWRPPASQSPEPSEQAENLTGPPPPAI